MSFRCLVGDVFVEDIRFPRPSEIDLDFMDHRLTTQKRFLGHPLALTIREHQVLCVEVVRALGGNAAAQRWAWFHDAHEFALGDWPDPLKRALGDEFPRIAARWDSAILAALGIPEPSEHDRVVVENADLWSREIEWHYCLGQPKPLNPGFALDGKSAGLLATALGEDRFRQVLGARRKFEDAFVGVKPWGL